MARYSRVAKYEDLRNKLLNENESEISSTPSLSAYEKRLDSINANINANSFKSETEHANSDYDPLHSRRRTYAAADDVQDSKTAPAVNTEKSAEKPSFLRTSDPFGDTFNNEYLDEYIKEVKQYNIDQGNAFSTDTAANVLQSLRENQTITTPIVNTPRETSKAEPETTDIPAMVAAPKTASTVRTADTSDIPFFSNTPAANSSKSDDRPTISATKDDIAAEVQNLIREQQGHTNDYTFDDDRPASRTNTNEMTDTLDRTTRQQLLNETTQIRAQLDDYDYHLSEVNDRMRRNSQIVNILMIVLIIALVVVLCVVCYWIISMRGI